MKNVFLVLALSLVSVTSFASNVIVGKECTINMYASNDDGGRVGHVDLESETSYLNLVKALPTKFKFKTAIPGTHHDYNDYEFLIELDNASGRSGDGHLTLKIIRTGKIGQYEEVFLLEAPTGRNQDAIVKSMINQIPNCIKR
jgi:hypothetical protein